MTNIYKYTFYLSYKLGKRIKTPEPEFAAACMVSAVMFSQLLIIVFFLDALKIVTIFIDSPWAKPIVAVTILFILYINRKYTFGLKESRYLKFIAIYDKDTLIKKTIKTFFTIFIILIIPIICFESLRGSAYDEAYIQRLLLNL